ncbi:MAG: tetratricopeptide repeat protein, partial [Candidatus Caenarcaniphilales bacterium]|nr:tetratricopeptide repeat protein [Candidatus Caenarcaniphilales bacterium]
MFSSLTLSLGVSARIVKASNGHASAAKVANLLEEAAKNFRDKNYQYSVELYKQALSLDDSNPGVHFGLGASYLAIKDYPLAVEYLQRAIELNPALVEAYFSLALAYQGMSQPSQSLKVYRQGLGLDLGTGLPRRSYSNQVTISNPEDSPRARQSDYQKPAATSQNNSGSSSLEIIESPENPVQEVETPEEYSKLGLDPAD